MYQATAGWIQRNRALILLVGLLLIVRIPHFNRPLSKHHDFNNAVMLINAASWQQGGGGASFWFTPLMNFQGEQNKLLERGPHIDTNSNHTYISYGPGFFMLPYFVFQALHIPPSPAVLELLNILLGLATMLLLYHFLHNWLNNKRTALQITALFTLMPGPLWYTGHSYNNVGIILPLVLYFLLLWQKAATTQKPLQASFFVQLIVCIFLLMYNDWIGAFLAAGIGLWALQQRKSHPSSIPIFFTAAIASTLSILFISWQFAQYLGWQQVMDYWQQRSTYRSLANQDEGWFSMLLQSVTHIGSGYSTLFLLLAYLIYRYRGLKWLMQTKDWLNWALIVVVIYNLIFFNWSAIHEFAWLPLALVSCIWIAVNQQELLKSIPRKVFVSIILIGLLQYFVLNLPGAKSINGTAYNIYQQQALQLNARIPANAVVYSNIPNMKILEWYAQRTFNHASSANAAANANPKLTLPVYWIQFDGIQITSIENLSALRYAK